MSSFKLIPTKPTFKISPKTIAALCLTLFIGLGVVACATAPINDQYLTTLRVNKVLDAGANGESVRWGGTIVSIENTDDGAIVEVVSRPLNGWGRPKRNDQTDGRFIAHLDQILDPEKVKKGMDVTMAGELTAVEDGVVGEMPYRFPVLTVSKLKVWQFTKQSVPYAYGYWQDPSINHLPHGVHRPYSAFDRQEGQFAF